MYSTKNYRYRGNAAIACLAILLIASPAAAADRDAAELIDKIGDCARISNSASRLNCYDTLNQSLQSVATAMPAAATQTIGQPTGEAIETAEAKAPAKAVAPEVVTEPSPPATTKPVKKTLFGSKADRPPDVQLTLIDSKKDAFGRWLFYFDNGAVWRQTEKGYVSIPKGDAVPATLSSGVLGSHNLRLGDSRRKTKVTRVK